MPDLFDPRPEDLQELLRWRRYLRPSRPLVGIVDWPWCGSSRVGTRLHPRGDWRHVGPRFGVGISISGMINPAKVINVFYVAIED